MPTIHSHTKTMPDGSEIDVFKLHKLLIDSESFAMPLSDIQKPSKSKRTGFSKIRSEKADISFPIIIDEQKFIIDGRHRYFKLLDRGQTNIKVIVANKSDIKRATINLH